MVSKCVKCGSSLLDRREVDERKLSICLVCCSFDYEMRRWTSGYMTIVDDIADGVALSRHYETPTVILINTAFRAESDGESSHAQMTKWAETHLIRFERRGDMTVFDRDGLAMAALQRGGVTECEVAN